MQFVKLVTLRHGTHWRTLDQRRRGALRHNSRVRHFEQALMSTELTEMSSPIDRVRHGWKWLKTTPVPSVLVTVVPVAWGFVDYVINGPAKLQDLMKSPAFVPLFVCFAGLSVWLTFWQWKCSLAAHREELHRQQASMLEELASQQKATREYFQQIEAASTARVDGFLAYMALVTHIQQFTEALAREEKQYMAITVQAGQRPGSDYPELYRWDSNLRMMLSGSAQVRADMADFYAMAFPDGTLPRQPLAAEAEQHRAPGVEGLPNPLALEYRVFDMYRQQQRQALERARERLTQQLAQIRNDVLRNVHRR